MNILFRYNALLYIVVLISITSFLTADEKPLGMLLALPVMALGWMTSRAPRTQPKVLPHSIINLLVFAAIVNAAVRTSVFRTDDTVVSTLGQFLVFIELIKLFDRRSARDDAQLLSLSVFVVIAAVLTSNSFLVGLQLLLFTPACIAATMLWQISVGLRPQEGEPAPPVVTGADPRRGFLLVCAGAMLACCVLAMGVFVLTPRGIGNDTFGRFGATRERQIGFTENVQLGNSGLLSEDPTPMMDVAVTTSLGETIGSVSQTLYLRGAARDRYRPQQSDWVDSTEVFTSQPRHVEAFSEDLLPASGFSSAEDGQLDREAALRVQRITMRAMPESRNLFAIWRPVSLASDRDLRFTLSPNRTIKLTESVSGRFTYTIKSILTDELRRPPLFKLGFQTGPIHDLTEQVLAERGAADPTTRTSRQMANAIRDHLRTRYEYTTEMEAPPPDMDAIEFFLFSRKRGHCEYFASAMAAMCQSIGMPARVVVGYVATEFNTLTGQYLVRQSNAHAWVEVFLITDDEAGRGRWETFDPSPPAEIERIHRPPAGVVAQLRSWYEALEFGWSNSIVGFDNLKQGRLFGRSPAAAAEGPRQVDQIAERIASWMKAAARDRASIPPSVRLLLPGLVIVAAAYLLWRFRNAEAGPKPRRVRTGVRFYDQARAQLARAGGRVAKPDSVPPLAHFESLQSVDSTLASAWREVTEFYYRIRFAGTPLTAGELSRANAALEVIRTRVRAIRSRSRMKER